MIDVCIYCSLVCCTIRVHNNELCTYNIVLLLHFDNKHHLLCFIRFWKVWFVLTGVQEAGSVSWRFIYTAAVSVTQPDEPESTWDHCSRSLKRESFWKMQLTATFDKKKNNNMWLDIATISKSSSVTTLVKLVRLGTFGLCAAPRCDNFGFTCTQKSVECNGTS